VGGWGWADRAALFHPAGLEDLEAPPDQPDPYRPWGPEARAGLHHLAAPCCRRSGRRVTSMSTPWSALLATRASLFSPRKSRPKIPAKKIKVDRPAQGKGSVLPPYWRSRSALSKLRADNAGRRWINGQTKMTPAPAAILAPNWSPNPIPTATRCWLRRRHLWSSIRTFIRTSSLIRCNLCQSSSSRACRTHLWWLHAARRQMLRIRRWSRFASARHNRCALPSACRH